MKKKKGFTLVELLAVIVVLAIIALITTPTILGVIEKARKNAFKNTIYGLMESTEIYLTKNLANYNNNEIIFTCNGNECINDNGDKLEFKGEVPKSGEIIVKDGKIEIYCLKNEKYCASGARNNLSIQKDCSALDITPPIDVTLSNKSIIDENTISLKYLAIDNESKINKVKCYYGDSLDDISTEGTINNGKCFFPSKAAYGKVCVTNEAKLTTCSEDYQLATYLIKNGKYQIPFTIKDVTITDNDGYLTMKATSGVRRGIYTTDSFDATKYISMYIETDYNLVVSDDDYDPSYGLAIGNGRKILYENISYYEATIFWKKNAMGEYSNNKAIYYQYMRGNSFDNAYVSIYRNACDAATCDLMANIYNVWFQ